MFTTDLKALAVNLAFLKRAAGHNRHYGNGIASLANIRAEVADGVLSLTMFDYETAVTVRQPVDASSDDMPEILLPIGGFVDAVKSAGKSRGVFTLPQSGDDMLQIVGEDMTVTVPLIMLDDADYPPALPEADLGAQANAIVTSGAELAASLAIVSPAAGKDDTLPMLTGVRVETVDGEVILAATDRFRLAERTVSTTNMVSDVETLIKVGPLAAFAKHVAKDESVSVTVAGARPVPSWSASRYVVLESDTARIVVREMDAEFPKFRGLFPARDTLKVGFTVDAASLVKRVKALPKSAARAIMLVDETVELVGAERQDTGAVLSRMTVDASEISLDDGLGIQIACDAKYLAEALGSVPKGEKVRIEFSTATRPMILTWERSRVLIMPIRLPDGVSYAAR